MAEPKRVPLQSVDLGAQTSKMSEKKTKKEKQIAPSIRFTLNLFESNDQKYPEFNYTDLLKNAEKKRKKEKKKEDNNVGNGGNLLEDSDDDEKVLDIARYFESKYGNRKKNDGIDLGAGYDESDSFIDNTDAYDEIVPKEWTTVHGGFYVNSGPLEYKGSDNAALLRRNSVNDENEDDEDESSEEDSEEDSKKVSNKRRLSSDNEEIDITQPSKRKSIVADTECV